jgi:CYTH domain-containing protein
MLEIERKFLVNTDAFKNAAFNSIRIVQGFLNTHPERTVRVRIKGNSGFITVKGISNEAGTIRTEWEKEIALNEAEMLLKICEEGIIEKTRYEIKVGNYIFEVDEFLGNNLGLIVAEIELSSENEAFEKPKWLGKEVTGEIKYYNSLLSKQPFNTWNI